jgi:hypothetical protein
MPKLVALKPFRLSGGRVFKPGDAFEVAKEMEARALVAIGKASREAPEPTRDPGRDVLRQQAEALGVEVDGRWGAARLQDEIAAAQARRQQTYQRRDMVAEEPVLRPYVPPTPPEPEKAE